MIPFSRPEIGEEEIDAVVNVLKSGWLTTGDQSVGFEEDFSDFIGNSVSAISVNSATAGLHLVLESLGIGPGDEVIVPTWTFTATAEVVEYLGATPVLVDVDKETHIADISKVAEAITSKTKALIIVHFAGRSAEVGKFRKIVGNKIAIIEDAAHALPSAENYNLVGTCASSDACVFSFYANKTMTTGEGGMVTTKNQMIASRIKQMRLHGIDRDVFNRYRSKAPSWQYDIIAAGYKYNLTDIASAMGRQQLKKVETMRNRREKIAERYIEEFRDLPLTLPSLVKEGDIHAWHLFTVNVNPETLTRNQFIQFLSEKGVGTSVHFIPLHKMTHWSKLDSAQKQFVNSDESFESIVSIPLYSSMSEEEIQFVIDSVKEIF